MAKEVLFSAQTQEGTYFQEVLKAEPEIKDYIRKRQQELAESFDDLFVKWYMKTGLFCKMTCNEFLDQPYWMMKAITKEIDRRLDDHKHEILNYEHLAVLLGLARAFGSNK